jgi:hypothetical protein
MNWSVCCRFPSKMGGSFPWRGSSLHPNGFGFYGSRSGGLGGGAGGGDPLNSFCDGFGFGVVVPNWFRVGRDHASLRLVEGISFGGSVSGGCVGAAMVWILLRVCS